MAVKLLLTWDILPGREQEYFEFVVREFIPAIQKLGLEPTDAWFTVYGNQPQIMAAIQGANLANVKRLLKSDEWDSLTHQLLDYVEDFHYKIVEARQGFQI
jgi:hypothetical protein